MNELLYPDKKDQLIILGESMKKLNALLLVITSILVFGCSENNVSVPALILPDMLAPVKVGDKWGYADLRGNLVIEAKFSDAKLFRENLAVVDIPDNPGRYTELSGVINTKGEYVVEPKFRTIEDFHKGIAIALTDETEKYGTPKSIFIDSTGEPAFSFSFKHGLSQGAWFNRGIQMHDRYRLVKVYDTYTHHFPIEHVQLIDIEESKNLGKKVASAIIHPFQTVKAFSDGVLTLYKEETTDPKLNKNAKKYGFMDVNGNMLSDFEYKYAQGFTEGLASVQVDGNKLWGYVDKKNNWVITPQFVYAGQFNGGLAAAENNEGLWGFINTKGQWVIAPQFKGVQPFEGDYALVDYDGVNGAIDTNIIDRAGRRVFNLEELRARGIHIHSQKGEIVIISDGQDKYGSYGKLGAMTVDGVILFMPKFDEMRDYSSISLD